MKRMRRWLAVFGETTGTALSLSSHLCRPDRPSVGERAEEWLDEVDSKATHGPDVEEFYARPRRPDVVCLVISLVMVGVLVAAVVQAVIS